jgi:multidrug efflux pump subunit AcrB
MTATRIRWRLVALICLALTSALLASGIVFFAVRAAFWPSDSARRRSASDSAWPSLRITARYDGANAQEVERTVAPPLEVQMAGLERLETIESVSREGSVTVTLYFSPGTDLDKAKTLVRERVSWAERAMPDEVKAHGVKVGMGGPLPALWLVLDSPDESRDQIFLRNHAQTVLLPELAATPGVSGASAGAGNGHSIGLFLDSDKLGAHGVGVADVKDALAERANGPDKAKPIEELLNLKVRTDADGRGVFLRDVATLEVFSSGAGEMVRWNGGTAAAIAVESEGDAGALFDTMQERLPELVGRLPKGTDLHLVAGPSIFKAEALLVDARLLEDTIDQLVQVIATTVAQEFEQVPDPKAARLVPCVLALPTDEPTTIRLYVALCPRKERAWSTIEIAARARAGLSNLVKQKMLSFQISAPEVLEMPPHLRDSIVIGLCGPEGDEAIGLADAVRHRLSKSELLSQVVAEYPHPVPQLFVQVDRQKAAALGLALEDVMDTVQAFMGNLHVPGGPQAGLPVGLGRGDAKADFGRNWILRVRAGFEKQGEDLKSLKVRDAQGNMVPLGALLTVRNTTTLPYIRRIDLKRCMLITASPAEGVSQGQANARAKEIATEVIEQMGLSKFCTVLQK